MKILLFLILALAFAFPVAAAEKSPPASGTTQSSSEAPPPPMEILSGRGAPECDIPNSYLADRHAIVLGSRGRNDLYVLSDPKKNIAIEDFDPLGDKLVLLGVYKNWESVKSHICHGMGEAVIHNPNNTSIIFRDLRVWQLDESNILLEKPLEE